METIIYKKSEREGYLTPVRGRSTEDYCRELEEKLNKKRMQYEGESEKPLDLAEYYSWSRPEYGGLKEIPLKADIICYAKEGSCEGHYVHVSALEDGKLNTIYLIKILTGERVACRIASMIVSIIYDYSDTIIEGVGG